MYITSIKQFKKKYRTFKPERIILKIVRKFSKILRGHLSARHEYLLTLSDHNKLLKTNQKFKGYYQMLLTTKSKTTNHQEM